MTEKGDGSEVHRTLFAVPLLDPRERKQLAGAHGRGASPRAWPRTSDVTRVRVLAVGALAAALSSGAAWAVVPSPPPAASGPLALPHRAAEIECAACHKAEDKPAAACSGCHGAHPSQRSAHRRLTDEGRLGCPRCHDIHGADQGVRFDAPGDGDTDVLRYGVGADRKEEHPAPRSDHPLTVPFIPVARCAPCHSYADPRDPMERCVLASQRGLGGAAINVCFDEHQRWSATDPPRPGGVCARQHANERFAAWEAAREVAAASPWPPKSGNARAVWWWLGVGLVGGFGGMLVPGAVARIRRQRMRKDDTGLAKPAERVRLPQVDAATCLGCHACVDACPFDVLAVERYVAVVVRPEACCGLTLCEQVCPNGSLSITDGAPIGDRPRLDATLQSLDRPGVYLAGDVTGVPLIKNAIVQGSAVVDHIADALPEHAFPLDLVVVGAGPAGIAAALRAKERGLRYRVLEQGSVAQSIRSFPRGKLIYDQPLELPLAGKLWLEEATKEELLAKWTRIVRQERLAIDEGMRLVGVTPLENGFEIAAEDVERSQTVEPYRAARVLLAIGMRGSPRKLELLLTPEIESKVFYHLADARSFAGQRVLVVGLGDTAMETAIAIAHQPMTQVTVAYRGDAFHRGKPRNVAELKRLVQAGKVELVMMAAVRSVEHEFVELDVAGAARRLPNDAMFVMIGSLPPSRVLSAAGVQAGATAVGSVTDPLPRATV